MGEQLLLTPGELTPPGLCGQPAVKGQSGTLAQPTVLSLLGFYS